MEKWQKASFDLSDLTEKVTGVLISAYGNEGYNISPTQELTNQWAMFLKLEDDTSVMIYMNSMVIPATLSISSKPYIGTYNTVKVP